MSEAKKTTTRTAAKLGVNPALAERLERYKVPRIPYQPVFDRVLVYQIDTSEEETFKGTSIIKADVSKTKERMQSPRGLLISAGLGARDHLEAHDIFVGDIVWFARHANWAYAVEDGGRHKHIVFLRSSEITGSEDALERIKTGETKFAKDPETGRWSVVDRPRFDIEAGADDM